MKWRGTQYNNNNKNKIQFADNVFLLERVSWFLAPDADLLPATLKKFTEIE